MKLLEYSSRDTMMEALADRVAQDLRVALDDQVAVLTSGVRCDAGPRSSSFAEKPSIQR